MKLFNLLVCSINAVWGQSNGMLLTGFGTRLDQLTDWHIDNDGVMGGLSHGYYTIEDHKMVFNGTISLDNNGGFSLVSGRNDYGEPIDVSAYEVNVQFKTFKDVGDVRQTTF